MNRFVGILAAALIPALFQVALARNDGRPSYGSPPTEGTAHVHQRYAAFNGGPAAGYNMVGYNASSTGGYGNLNTPGPAAKQPFYGFGSLNNGPFGTGRYGSGGSGNANYNNANYRSRGYGASNGRYGYGGFGGYGYGMGGYGYGGYGLGGYGYGYGPYGLYGYGATGALGYGDPHARFYFGASPINDPSTYRYGGRSAVPQVPPFQNFAQPSSLVPYSYLYVNPRTPQEPGHPQTVANPFVEHNRANASPAAK